MAIEVETKDCSMLGDGEIEEMAALCEEGNNSFGIGLLSKQAEAWVLVTTAREGGRLKGFSFSTLERIGGTPSVIIGASSIQPSSPRNTVLRAVFTELQRRAVMAFPDEDVVFGSRFNDPGALELYKPLSSLIPRPDHRASGEERAWGRRFVKRFGLSSLSYDEKSFTAIGDGSQPCVFDHTSLKPEGIRVETNELFKDLNMDRGDTVVAWGWAMSEDLAKLA